MRVLTQSLLVISKVRLAIDSSSMRWEKANAAACDVVLMGAHAPRDATHDDADSLCFHG